MASLRTFRVEGRDFSLRETCVAEFGVSLLAERLKNAAGLDVIELPDRSAEAFEVIADFLSSGC